MADPRYGGQYANSQPYSQGYSQQSSGYGGGPPPPSNYPQTQAYETSAPNYRWFVDGRGIRRDVIQADIQRYLGPDALVKPGEQNVRASTVCSAKASANNSKGVPGFWIAAYRTLTAVSLHRIRHSIHTVNDLIIHSPWLMI
jgi:hypothetical protein